MHIVNVVVLDNPSPFFNPFQFEITFECVEDLQEGENTNTNNKTWLVFLPVVVIDSNIRTRGNGFLVLFLYFTIHPLLLSLI